MYRAMYAWAGWMSRASLPIVTIMMVMSALVLYWTVGHLGMSTDTSDMLSAKLPFRQIYADFQQSFPQYTDTMIVLVDGDTPDLASAASDSLADRLRHSDGLFKSVYQPMGGEFFERHSLLYMNVDELQMLADKLMQFQAFFGRLARDPSLSELLRLTGLALGRVEAGESLEIGPFLRQLDAALTANNDGHFYQVSWQQLLHGSAARMNDRRQLILLQPRLDYSRLQPATDAMQAVRQAIGELQLDPAHGVRAQVTGEVALAYEELQSASRGALIAGVMSLLLVAVVLGMGLGSWQLVLATLITLLSGLIMTAGFAAATIGHLNLISIAFAVLYIGLGVDYAIHLCLRYRELLWQGSSQISAMRRAMCDIGGSLFICTATTATGFYAFVPTSFTGVSELGLIAGTGMVISLALSLSLLPALLSLLPSVRPVARRMSAGNGVSRLLRMPAKYPRAFLWVAVGATLVSILALPAVRFDANPIDLRDPDSESVRAFNKLLQDSATSPWNLKILADNQAEAKRRVEQTRQLAVVDDAITINRFIPENQPDKLALIDDLNLLLGPLQVASPGRQDTQPQKQLASLQNFAAVVDDFPASPEPLSGTVRHLDKTLQGFLAGLSAEPAAERQRQLLALERSVLGSLPALLNRLATALQATAIRYPDLPTDLLRRWVTGDGRLRIDVFPSQVLDNEADLEKFVTAVQSVAPRVTGPAVFNIESGRVVVSAFAQALLSALVVITFLLLILLPRKRDVILVLAPLSLAAMMTAAIAVVADIPFNFANVIALPLLLGIGVDSGVHMVHRYRTALPDDGDLLGSSTIRAIVVSALTTIFSFGNLAFSPHPGAASMGQLLTIGTGATMFCMLAVLPALLYRRAPLQGKTG